MLKLEAYNLLWNTKETISEVLKTRFKRFEAILA